jgi:hypothetical protein
MIFCADEVMFCYKLPERAKNLLHQKLPKILIASCVLAQHLNLNTEWARETNGGGMEELKMIGTTETTEITEIVETSEETEITRKEIEMGTETGEIGTATGIETEIGIRIRIEITSTEIEIGTKIEIETETEIEIGREKKIEMGTNATAQIEIKRTTSGAIKWNERASSHNGMLMVS